jgi:hypothetical protein
MWYEELPQEKSWGRLWSGYTICGRCYGIRSTNGTCGVCGDPPHNAKPYLIRDENGKEYLVHPAVPGAEGRYEDWLYLQMIEREWKRPVLQEEPFSGSSPDTPSPRASIVILFWSYFETRIERLLREALRAIPGRILDDTLRRYPFIGTRLNEFYRVAFDSTYKNDLEAVGRGQVWPHLAKVQERRNQFAHGQPQAIDDALVKDVVENLKIEHEAWIAVFNKRAARS